ncbi:hypothetical protein KP509_13G001600 [Ceratopteris richardii]|nr:hypothetical protein KP509_13G001600 [Ceratopteris richardii]
MIVENHLVHAYGICGELQDSRKIFDVMPQRNLFSWNIMIGAYASSGSGDQVVNLLYDMFNQGPYPNYVTYISVLRACTSSEMWEEAKLIHSVIVEGGSVPCNVENAIFSMYAKCGNLQDALTVFERMESRNEVSWNALISAYASKGCFADAFHSFNQMILQGCNPGRATYMTLLNAFDDSSILQLGRSIHVQFMGSNIEPDIVLNTAFLNMYRKNGSLRDARTLFDNLPQRNLVSWNVMLATYAENGSPGEALALLGQMYLQQVKPDGITFITILNTCSEPAMLINGEIIFDGVVKWSMESDALVGSSLLSMYGKCAALYEARALLERMPDNNMVAWNSMLAIYAQKEHTQEAIELFGEMQARGLIADRVTCISMIRACSQPSMINQGIRLHVLVFSTTLKRNTAVCNALITMYGKCKKAAYAEKVFKAMTVRDQISWNALIAAYAQQEDVGEILNVLLEMYQNGVKPNKASLVSALDACCMPVALTSGQIIHYQILDLGLETDVMLGTALFTMYGKCNKLEDARRVFDFLPKHDVVSWSAMISMYGQHGHGKEAFRIFHEMPSGGLVPNRVTYISILDACASVAALPEGKLVHACFTEGELELDVIVGNAFISMYGKCGSLENAVYMFKRMKIRDVVSWSALIAAFSQHGHGEEAINIFCEMLENCVRPDNITFVSVLSACSHAGLFAEGCKYFDSMEEDHGLTATEDHYLCMIDLFGRMGRLDEAEKYLLKIPGKPGIVAWMTLLSASRLHNDLERGCYAAEKVLEIDPQNDAVYVTLSNMLSAAGKWDEAAKLRKIMIQRGIKKSQGWSSITVDGRVTEFSAGDTSHPQTSEIHSELDKITEEIKMMGYVPDTKLVLHDVVEAEKELLLCHHSERLAITFGLINTQRGTPLHVIKNLRVCSDCHTATKYISKLTKRTIIVRDANRFHHFENGICSCGDYW